MAPCSLFDIDAFLKTYGEIQHIRYLGKKPSHLYPGNLAIRAEPQLMGTPWALELILYYQCSIVLKQSQWQGPMGEPRLLEVDTSSTSRLYRSRKLIAANLPDQELIAEPLKNADIIFLSEWSPSGGNSGERAES
jgi:hypothetical protein